MFSSLQRGWCDNARGKLHTHSLSNYFLIYRLDLSCAARQLELSAAVAAFTRDNERVSTTNWIGCGGKKKLQLFHYRKQPKKRIYIRRRTTLAYLQQRHGRLGYRAPVRYACAPSCIYIVYMRNTSVMPKHVLREYRYLCPSCLLLLCDDARTA